MSGQRDPIGLIAGGGTFPIMIADAARKQGFSMVAVAHQGETDSTLSEKVDKIIWIKLGQLGKLIDAFKNNGVHKALMAGTITKHRMFGDISPDIKGLTLMSKVAIFHDDSILQAVADVLSKEGIEVISSTQYLPELLAPSGCLTKRKPNKAEKEDILLGWQVAKELGKLDIGQAMSPPLIKAVKSHTNSAEMIIIDAPPGTSCPVIEAVKGSDVSLLVTEPTPFGLNDLRLAVETLRKLKIPFGVIINRSDIGDKQVQDYCDKENIPVLMTVPLDMEIARFYSRGITLAEGLPEWQEKFAGLFEKITEIVDERSSCPER